MLNFHAIRAFSAKTRNAQGENAVGMHASSSVSSNGFDSIIRRQIPAGTTPFWRKINVFFRSERRTFPAAAAVASVVLRLLVLQLRRQYLLPLSML